MNGSFGSELVASYPEIGAIALFLLGVVAARLARSATGRALEVLDAWSSRYTTGDASVVSPTLQRLAKALVFWLIVLLAVIFALRMLGVGELSAAFDSILAFVPGLLVGITIIGAGHLLGMLSASLTARLGDTTQPDSLGPRLVHATVFVIALVMGLQHMKIDITFITQLMLVLVVVVLGGTGLAFALGARQHVANLVAQSELQRYSIGQRIRVGSDDGTIVEIYRTGVVLETSEGMASIPAARFARMRVLRLAQDSDNE